MTKMIAMSVPERGGRFRKEERDLPEPGRHEVRIRVHACGVCHSDVLTVQGLIPGISYPRIPGHEVIGVIDALGPDVEGWNVGTRVGVGWSSGSCNYCGHCRRGNTFACETIQGATGVSRDGGSYWNRLGNIAVWNSVMDEDRYLTRKWNEFLTS